MHFCAKSIKMLARIHALNTIDSSDDSDSGDSENELTLTKEALVIMNCNIVIYIKLYIYISIIIIICVYLYTYILILQEELALKEYNRALNLLSAGKIDVSVRLMKELLDCDIIVKV